MTKQEEALRFIQKQISAYLRNASQGKEIAQKSGCCKIAAYHWEQVHSQLYQLKFDIEKHLDKLGLNEFCSLAAFSPKTRKEIDEMEKEK